jgi:hypothetical protein
MSHGSISVTGTTNTYAGIAFPDVSAVYMATNTLQGVYRNNNQWLWRFNTGTLDIGSIPAARVNSGTLDAARIPNLPASRITSGAFDAARIPNLDASKITSGIFGTGRIPNLGASKITAGTFPQGKFDWVRSGSAGTVICMTWSSDLGTIIRFNANGSAANRTQSWGSTSDERLKTNITDARDYLTDLRRVRIRKFAFKDTPDQIFLGVIAQELLPIFPGLVEADEEGIYTVKMSIFIPMLIKTVQELANKNDALETRTAALEIENAQLKTTLEDLVARVTALETS